MDYFVALRLKAMNFFKRNKKKIFVFLIIWLIIIIVNLILKNRPVKLPEPSTTYQPHVSVLDSKKEVPEKYREPIENLVDKYFNYCNNGEYEKAYNLITAECREKNYPTLEQFKGYVNHVFEGKKKIYNIQNYSIVDNKYIYDIRILDDILATGTNDGYYYYDEKIVLIEENGNMKLSIAEYIGEEKINAVSENDDIIVEVIGKSVDYETETYTVKVTNKTDKYVVIADNTKDNEIILDLGTQTRRPTNMTYGNIIIKPNSSVTQTLVFDKFYDNGLKAQKLTFGQIRILNEYNYQTGTTQQNIDSAVKLYGLEINL